MYTACYHPRMFPADVLQDRNHDDIVELLNARIYIADLAPPSEIAAAANIAARLAFESTSFDLPAGFPISEYRSSDTSVAIVVGTAAGPFVRESNAGIVRTMDGTRRIVAIPRTADAEQFARTLKWDLRIALDPGLKLHHVPGDKQFSLSSLFTAQGWLGDDDGDFIPEKTETTIVLGPDVHATGIIDLAARIALESAGLRLPLVVEYSDEMPPNAILIGRTNRHVQELIRSRQFSMDPRPGYGKVEILSASDRNTVVVIAGTDDAGEAEAIRHAAERLPNVWEFGKDRLHLSDIESDLRRFLSRRSEAGQAAAALGKAKKIAAELGSEDCHEASLEFLIDGKCRPELDHIAAQFGNMKVTASNLGVHSGPLVFEDTFVLPWEGDESRRRITQEIVPAVLAGSSVDIELRISESPQVRAALSGEIRETVLKHGANPDKLSIRILAAHKQAYCWLDEVLKPRLSLATRIRILYRELQGKSSTVESADRWLHELYPIDEVLSRDLKIPLSDITFHASTVNSNSTYEVFAEDASGSIILHESFEPKYAMRPMFDLFPDYAQIRVGTGWLRAIVDESVVADRRIETDPEKFWNYYQATTLPKIRTWLLHLYEGRLRPECAPHFAVLEVDLWLSEPDYNIGIDEERMSTLEALHEDIYFETLLFFELMGLNHPGRIIPRVHRARDGQDGLAIIRFTGKAGPNPRVSFNWTNREGKALRRTEDLLPLSDVFPRISSITVRSGHNSVVELGFTHVPDSQETRSLFETIRGFHNNGVGLNWLSYQHVDQMTILGIPFPQTEECYRKPRIESRSGGMPIVEMETPIGPDECRRIIERLAASASVRPFLAGESFLGCPVWALEVVAPEKGKFRSQAKASVMKPVLFITGRQHANEVSSTSHILRLAELLVSDPETGKLLDHVNFILQPMTNPDGAALVEELHRDTPGFMLHAGYLGALGMDVTSEQWSENPLCPEALVRTRLWRMWVPDIVLNPHGYPSHEWVQLFAGYTAWVKSRTMTARDWWIPRGWFIPRFEYMEESCDAAFALRDRVMASMNETLGPWHERMQRRYLKYGAAKLTETRTECGLRTDPEGFSFMQRYPHVTFMETVSEAPDEVAEGDWLKTLAQTGLEFSLAHARYLAENHAPVKRSIQHSADTTVLRISRKRP